MHGATYMLHMCSYIRMIVWLQRISFMIIDGRQALQEMITMWSVDAMI